MPNHPRYLLILEAKPKRNPSFPEQEWSPIIRLRLALKRFLRDYGLTCIEAKEIKDAIDVTHSGSASPGCSGAATGE